MSPERLAALRPRAWHLAERSAGPSIVRHGLLSAAALLDLHGVDADGRRTIRDGRRRASMPLGDGSAVLRDQTPLVEAGLERALIDMTAAQWRDALDARVFLWLTRARVDGHRGARLLRARPQLLYELDTRALLSRHADAVELSPINSGNTRRRAAPRGSTTFCSLADWTLPVSRIVELTVRGGIPDLDGIVVGVAEV